MSKYSSDSDSYTEKRSSKKYSRRSRSRDRSYSSDSSSSRNKKRKDKKYTKRDRSRSRGSDKYSRSRVDRSSSYQSKSYTSKSRYSNSPDRSRKRSTSRDRYKSKYRSRRSRSNSRNKYRKSRKSHSHSRDSSKHKDKSPSTSSSSSRTSYEKDKIDGNKYKDNQTEKSTKIITDVVKSKLKKLSVLKNEEEKINLSVIDEINDDSFAPKAFVSSKTNKRVSDNIVIDLKSQTIKIPDVEITEPDSIFHPNLFINEEARMEKWIKELYIYRQKAFNGEINI